MSAKSFSGPDYGGLPSAANQGQTGSTALGSEPLGLTRQLEFGQKVVQGVDADSVAFTSNSAGQNFTTALTTPHLRDYWLSIFTSYMQGFAGGPVSNGLRPYDPVATLNTTENNQTEIAPPVLGFQWFSGLVNDETYKEYIRYTWVGNYNSYAYMGKIGQSYAIALPPKSATDTNDDGILDAGFLLTATLQTSVSSHRSPYTEFFEWPICIANAGSNAIHLPDPQTELITSEAECWAQVTGAQYSSLAAVYFHWTYLGRYHYDLDWLNVVSDSNGSTGSRHFAVVLPVIRILKRRVNHDVDGGLSTDQSYVIPSSHYIAGLGLHNGLPARGVCMGPATLSDLGGTKKTIPSFRGVAFEGIWHTRFIGFVAHVTGDVYVFSYFQNLMTYGAAKQAWTAAAKAPIPNTEPIVYENRTYSTLTAARDDEGNLSEFAESCSAHFQLKLAYTTDAFATSYVINDYTEITLTPIDYKVDQSNVQNWWNHVGAREFKNDETYIKDADGYSSKFATGTFTEGVFFNPTQPLIIPALESGLDFLLISLSPRQPIYTVQDQLKYKYAIYRVKDWGIKEQATLSYDHPILIMAGWRAYDRCFIQISHLVDSDDIATAGTSTGISILVSPDEGVTWVAHNVPFEPRFCGIASLSVTPGKAEIVMPVFDPDDESYYVYRLYIDIELGPLYDDPGWQRGGRTYKRVTGVSGIDDYYPGDQFIDNQDFENALVKAFMLRCSPVYQAAYLGDTGFRNAGWYKDVVFKSDTDG